jgi:hypothetical protein
MTPPISVGVFAPPGGQHRLLFRGELLPTFSNNSANGNRCGIVIRKAPPKLTKSEKLVQEQMLALLEWVRSTEVLASIGTLGRPPGRIAPRRVVLTALHGSF